MKKRYLSLSSAICLVLGIVLLSAAALSAASAIIEPENGALSTNVTTVSDAAASGGKYVGFTSGSTGTTGRCQHTATRICYNGKLWYINGVNMPWYQWGGDFGGGAIQANKADIQSRFASLHSSGSTVVRWWTFEGGAWQINRAADGTPTSLNTAVYADFDAALQLADQYDLYYDFTLFSGVANGDFPSSWRTNAAQRTALANVLAPLFARYKDNPRVMTWELFNEPEWQIWNGIDGANEADSVALAKALVSSIRSNAPKTLITIGQAQLTGIPMWKGVDLDYDSPHYYDNFGHDPNVSPYDTTAAAQQTKYGTTRPIVIGEYPFVGTNSENVTRLNDMYNRGFAGAWAWSLFYDHTGDRIQVDMPAMTTFGGQHTDLGPH